VTEIAQFEIGGKAQVNGPYRPHYAQAVRAYAVLDATGGREDSWYEWNAKSRQQC
jgi:hypothetical protein